MHSHTNCETLEESHCLQFASLLINKTAIKLVFLTLLWFINHLIKGQNDSISAFLKLSDLTVCIERKQTVNSLDE